MKPIPLDDPVPITGPVSMENVTPWNSDQMFSSKSVEWATPQDLYDKLDGMFSFDMDAAATRLNAKCSLFLDRMIDALNSDWSMPEVVREKGINGDAWTAVPSYHMRSVFLNPPWGRGIGRWLEKAYKESRKGVTVCCVIPACTDTRWWKDWVWKASEVRFVTGRLHFVRDDGHTGPATKGACVVVFTGWSEGPPACSLMGS